MWFDVIQIRFAAYHQLHLTAPGVGTLTQFANFRAKCALIFCILLSSCASGQQINNIDTPQPPQTQTSPVIAPTPTTSMVSVENQNRKPSKNSVGCSVGESKTAITDRFCLPYNGVPDGFRTHNIFLHREALCR
jgi:hypothetical protein